MSQPRVRRAPSRLPSGEPAFTLIELLVVIAIIALLASILLPVLGKVKEVGTGARCAQNQLQLITAWTMYADDNDGWLVGGPNLPGGGFWPGPQPVRGGGGSRTERHKVMVQEGLRMGPLFKYCPSVGAYHCPGDLRTKLASLGQGYAYDSYSLAGGLNAGGWGGAIPILKFSEIQDTANTYVFVEEADSRGYNLGAWVLNPLTHTWVDPIAIWHNEKSTLSFADGHVDIHKWVEESTIAAAAAAHKRRGTPFYWPRATPIDRDFDYMEPGFIYRK